MKGKKFHRRRIYFFLFASCQRKKHPNSSIRYLNTDATRVCFHEKVLVNVIYKSLEEKSHGNVFRQLVGTLQCPPFSCVSSRVKHVWREGEQKRSSDVVQVGRERARRLLKVAWRSRVPWSTTLSRDTFYLNKRTPPPSPWFKKAGQKSAFTICSPRVKTFERVLPLAEEILTPARTLFTGEITLGGEGRPVLDSERASCIIACTQPAYNDTRPPFLLLQPRSLWLCHLSNLYDEKRRLIPFFPPLNFNTF